MLKKTILTVSLIMAMALNAHALTYSFWGQDEGGVGSAEMGISISGNTLTMKLDNTSPTKTGDGEDWNISAITSFGINLGNDPLPMLNSWSLTAFTTNNAPFTMGSNVGTDNQWNLRIDQKQEGVTLDYLANNGNGIHKALYNPELWRDTSFSFDNNSGYLTEAVLTMTFDSQPILAEPNNLGSGLTGFTYVRFQRVGLNTDGSLKLVGAPFLEEPGGGPPPAPVPEPGTIVLLGAGLLGLGAAYVRRRRNS